MSILNNTLKSLDERSQDNDFGLPPTVTLPASSLRKKILIIIIPLALAAGAATFFFTQSNVSEKGSATQKATSNVEGNDVATRKQPSGQSLDAKNATNDVKEGMIPVPLSDSDKALIANATPVVDQVSERLQQINQQGLVSKGTGAIEDKEDDEAEYKKQKRIDTEKKRSSEVSISTSQSLETAEAASVKSESLKAGIIETVLQKRVLQNPKLKELAPKSLKEQSEEHLKAGLKAYQFGMFEDAEKSFSLALSTNPENSEARKQLSALYFGKNNIPMALSVLSDGVSVDPQNITWRELMGKILIAQNRFEDALNVMPDALDQSAFEQQRTDYLVIKGTAAQAINKPEIALSAFSYMTLLQPQNAKWWLALGANYDALDQQEQAVQAFEKSLANEGLSLASKQYVVGRLNAIREER